MKRNPLLRPEADAREGRLGLLLILVLAQVHALAVLVVVHLLKLSLVLKPGGHFDFHCMTERKTIFLSLALGPLALVIISNPWQRCLLLLKHVAAPASINLESQRAPRK